MPKTKDITTQEDKDDQKPTSVKDLVYNVTNGNDTQTYDLLQKLMDNGEEIHIETDQMVYHIYSSGVDEDKKMDQADIVVEDKKTKESKTYKNVKKEKEYIVTIR